MWNAFAVPDQLARECAAGAGVCAHADDAAYPLGVFKDEGAN